MSTATASALHDDCCSQDELDSRRSHDANEIVVLLPLSNHEELSFDRLIRTKPQLLISNTPIVYVDSAAANQSGRVALGARHPCRRQQFDNWPSVGDVSRRGRGHVGEDLEQVPSRTWRRRLRQKASGTLLPRRARPYHHERAPSRDEPILVVRDASQVRWTVAASSSAIRVSVQKREEFQVSHGVAVVRVEPELIKLVRLGQLRIEPDCSCLGLAELGSRRRRHQRQAPGHAPCRPAVGESDPCLR